VVFYHPYAYAIGFRDVAAAWLICLAFAACGAACEAIAAPEDLAAAGSAVCAPFFAGPHINGGSARSPSHQHA
jgi:hypothetical protein